MATPAEGDAGQLHTLNLDILRRAIDIYMRRAYPDGPPPEVVRRRLDWPADADAARLLSGPPFERVRRPEGAEPMIFALRLGNARYPHMKLQVQPWPNAAGFLLSVNTHDQVLALDPNAADSEAFRALQAENQRIKEAIESAWDQDGLPTFLRYLRDYIQSHPGAPETA
ncbi:MAG TPA: hypothetical protein VG406_21255 [Isosphaeraceae bacterium]|jgi:hypothetical protein|nr:hypothetical protein [Isosphaeraceae bacterium]